MTLSSKLDSVCAVSVQECQLLKLNFKAVSSILAVVVFYGLALWNRADHYIFILSFVVLLLSFFPRLTSAAAHWMSAILPHMVWP